MKKIIFGFFADSVILIACFYFVVWLRFNTVFVAPLLYKLSFYYYGIFIVLSLITNKNKVLEKNDYSAVLYPIALSNLIILAFFVFLGRFIYPFSAYHFLSLYAVILASIFEILGGLLIVIYRKAKYQHFYLEHPLPDKKETEKIKGQPVLSIGAEIEEDSREAYLSLSSVIIEETSQKTLEFIKPYFTKSVWDTIIISTTNSFNLLNQPRTQYQLIVNLKRINDIRYLNRFFETVNAKLDMGGLFIDWVETFTLRRKRILSKYPGGTNYIIYTIDFIFHRILPKLPLAKNIYFFITQGQNRLLSKAETLGRLYSCGFEVVQESLIQGYLYFVVRKIKKPSFDKNPTYGPMIKLKRIGKDGKIIRVYKLRTMHAYSEYIQGYVFQQNQLQEGGKFKNDFRITALGRIFRELWLDELPMMINLFKGEIKLVGVRPLSQHYYDLYTEELRKKRIKYKPGLIPPFYADMPVTLEEIMASEIRYLESYEKNPARTDLRYFFKAVYNIIFKHARSN